MYPKPYIDYLAHFHGDRDYFECHEILEEYWKEQDKGNKHSIWVAFIQLAVGCYHHRRRNYHGAAKTLEKALAIFTTHQNELPGYGLRKEELLEAVSMSLLAAQQGQEYRSMEIPIADEQLKKLYAMECAKKGIELSSWGFEPSADIVHRHKTRDRTPVILERKEALDSRRN